MVASLCPKGQLTRALKDGTAQRITAAEGREREAYAEADAIAHECIDEMLAANAAGLENLGGVLDEIGRAWAASEATIRFDREAGA